MTDGAWNDIWETDLYGQGRKFNLYPDHVLVGFIFGTFGGVPDRKSFKILEFGSGAGNNMWFAAREGFNVAGIDGSPSAVKFAQDRFARDGLDGDFRVADFTDVPWPDASVDLVVDRGAVNCVDHKAFEKTMDEALRVLKPGGCFYSSTYSHDHSDRQFGTLVGHSTYDNFTGGYFEEHGLTHFCTREDIEKLYGSHFDIVSLRHVIDSELVDPTRTVMAVWNVVGRKPA